MAALGTLLEGMGFGGLNAYCLMVFALLYTPCIAALATIHRESRSWKWTGLCVVFQFAVAWIAAVLIFQAGSLFLGG